MNVRIYKITNQINQKIYVGLTQSTLQKRFAQHWKHRKRSTPLGYALVKYGKENFTIEQIDSAETLFELSEKEKFWIKKLDSTNKKKGYNILSGGLCFDSDNATDYWHGLSEEEKIQYGQNMSKILQGKIDKRKKANQFIGVSKPKNRHQFSCRLKINKKVYRREFDDETEAAKAYDRLVVYFYGSGRLNFPELLHQYQNENLQEFFNQFILPKKKGKRRGPFCRKHPHKYKYVTWVLPYGTKNYKWRADIHQKVNGKLKNIFSFCSDNEEEAYLARQAKLKELGAPRDDIF